MGKTQTKTILKCGTSVGSVPLSCNNVMVQSVGGSNGYGCQPVVLSTVALDTGKLIDPTVKIDFSSLISFKTCSQDNFTLRLTFKLSKICCGGPIPLGTWTFEQTNYCVLDDVAQVDGGYVQETESFCFSICQCDVCPDCCNYIVEIVDQQCYNINFVNVGNISLAALAVGLKESHRD